MAKGREKKKNYRLGARLANQDQDFPTPRARACGMILLSGEREKNVKTALQP